MPNNCHGLWVTPESRVAPKKSMFKCIKSLTSKATDPLKQFQYADSYRTLGFALMPVITVTQTRKNRDLHSTNITNHLSVHISDFLSIFKDTFITSCGSKRSGSWHFGHLEKQWPWLSHWPLRSGQDDSEQGLMGFLWENGVEGWNLEVEWVWSADKTLLSVNSMLWWEILMTQCLKTVI